MNQDNKLDLGELRREIDRIDSALVSLFSERMQVSARVAEYKRRVGMAVTDATREAELLDRVAALSPAQTADYTRTLYTNILSLSRAYQHMRLGNDSALSAEIDEARRHTPPLFPTHATVACQGTPTITCVTAPDGSCCTITMTQQICVSIPVCYGVTMGGGETTIACADNNCIGCGCC